MVRIEDLQREYEEAYARSEEIGKILGDIDETGCLLESQKAPEAGKGLEGIIRKCTPEEEKRREEIRNNPEYDSIRKEQAELHLKMIRLHREIEKLKAEA